MLGTLADFAAAGRLEPVILYRSLMTDPASTGSAYSAIWSVFEIGGTRSAGVSRCRCGVIQPVQRAPQRADPARLRTVAPTGRAAAQEVAGGWRVSEETGARARPGEPLSAITARCVSFVAMLILGPVIAPG